MRPAALTSLTACTVLALLPGGGRADTVKLFDKPAFRHVTVTSFQAGRLHFRGVSGQTLRKPLDQVEWIEIDRYPALGEAERIRISEPRRAIAAYTQSLTDTKEAWLGVLIRVRLTAAYDRAGQFDLAMASFLELVVARVPGLDRWAPRRPGPPGADVNRAARELIRGARRQERLRYADDLLRRIEFESLLVDGVVPLPAEFTRTPPRSEQADDDGPTLLFDREATRPTGPPVLPAGSMVFGAARAAFQEREYARSVRLLERAVPFAEPAAQPRLRLLLGRARIETGQPARAADELLALSASDADDAIRAEALYYVAFAHERLDRADVARSLYLEVLTSDAAPERVRRLSRAGLARIGE